MNMRVQSDVCIIELKTNVYSYAIDNNRLFVVYGA